MWLFVFFYLTSVEQLVCYLVCLTIVAFNKLFKLSAMRWSWHKQERQVWIGVETLNFATFWSMFCFTKICVMVYFTLTWSGATVFEKTRPRHGDSRQRHTNNDPSDIGGYLGPWGKFIDEKIVMKPSEVGLIDYSIILPVTKILSLDTSNPLSFCPISHLSFLSKFIERCITN